MFADLPLQEEAGVQENRIPYHGFTPDHGSISEQTPQTETGIPETRIPAARFGQTRHTPLFDAQGYPCGEAWDEVLFPVTGDDGLYALDIDDHSFAPTYRSGDRLVISPTAAIRVGDRVVVGQVVVGTGPCTVHIGDLLRITARRMDIRVLGNTTSGVHAETPPKGGNDTNILTVETAAKTRDRTHWCARILWVQY